MIGTEAETETGIGTDIVTGTGIVHRERQFTGREAKKVSGIRIGTGTVDS